MEGGHSAVISRCGVAELIAVEARVDNYVRACVIGNVLGLRNTRFCFDDARRVTRQTYGEFDVVFCLGVLYHLPDPDTLLANLAELAPVVLVSTHYADEAQPSGDAPNLAIETRWGPFYGRRYDEGGLTDPLSGVDAWSFWPFRDELLRLCRDAGFESATVIYDRPDESTAGRPLINLVLRTSTAPD